MVTKKHEELVMCDLTRNDDRIQALNNTLSSIEKDGVPEELRDFVDMSVVVDAAKKKRADQVKAERINIQERVDTFLGAYQSENTKETYRKALNHFFDYLAGKDISPVLVRAYQADQYLQYLEGEDLSASTKRLYIAGISSFYSHLERWDDIEKNPFRGAKRPKSEDAKKAVPSDQDLEETRKALELDLYATGRGAHNRVKMAKMLLPAIHVMATYGLRVGALQTLYVDMQGNYTGASKGKKIQGSFTAGTLGLLRSYGRGGSKPFPDLQEGRVRMAMHRLTKRLYQEGRIQSEYSPHSLRHYFAISDYQQNKDIYRLKTLLDHASIQVTENYLRSLGVTLKEKKYKVETPEQDKQQQPTGKGDWRGWIHPDERELPGQQRFDGTVAGEEEEKGEGELYLP